jgi:hypothetical protein
MKAEWLSRRRVAYVSLLVVVSVIGIASRAFQTGYLLFDKYLGDVVYAFVFYLFLGALCDRWTPGRKAVLTLVFVLTVEVFQLTLIPLRLSLSNSFLLRFASILLGTQFGWRDIVAYLLGIAGVYLADRFYVSRLS